MFHTLCTLHDYLNQTVCTNKLEYVHITQDVCNWTIDCMHGHLYTREMWIQDISEKDLDHGIDINELAYKPKCLHTLPNFPCV